MRKEKIRKDSSENILDFIINHNGSIEDDLIDFMIEQDYNEIEDFATDGPIIKTSILTKDNTSIIGSKTNDTFDLVDSSFDTSFDLSFES